MRGSSLFACTALCAALLASGDAVARTSAKLDIVVEVDIDLVLRDQTDETMGDIRRAMRELTIPYRLSRNGSAISVELLDASRLAQARASIRAINPEVPRHGRIYDVSEAGNVFTLKIAEGYETVLPADVTDRAIVVMRVRSRELGLHPRIERLGPKQLALHYRGRHDYSEIIAAIEPPKPVSFRMARDLPKDGVVPADAEVLQMVNPKNAEPSSLLVDKKVQIDGHEIKNASWSNKAEPGMVVVTLLLSEAGAVKFAQITKDHVGERLAIVMGDKVLTAPVIREPILGGSMQIAGDFTIQSANDLAILLRAGAIPAPFRVLRCELTNDAGEKGPCPLSQP